MKFSKVMHAVVFASSSAVCRFLRCAKIIATALACAFRCSSAQTMHYDPASTSPTTADIQADGIMQLILDDCQQRQVSQMICVQCKNTGKKQHRRKWMR